MAIRGPIYTIPGGHDFNNNSEWKSNIGDIAEAVSLLPVNKTLSLHLNIADMITKPLSAEIEIERRNMEIRVFRDIHENFTFSTMDRNGNFVPLSSMTFDMTARATAVSSMMANGFGMVFGVTVMSGLVLATGGFVGAGLAVGAITYFASNLVERSLFGPLASIFVHATKDTADHTVVYEIANGVRTNSSIFFDGWDMLAGPREAAADLLTFRLGRLGASWEDDGGWRDRISIYAQKGGSGDPIEHQFTIYGPDMVAALQTALAPLMDFITHELSPVVKADDRLFLLGPDSVGGTPGGLIFIDDVLLPRDLRRFNPSDVILADANMARTVGTGRVEMLIGDPAHSTEETFDAGRGRDLVLGLGGRDIFIGASGRIQLDGDVFYGGDMQTENGSSDASDTVSYAGLGAGVLLSLHGTPRDITLRNQALGMAAVSRAGGPKDRLFEIENVVGTRFADFVEGDDGTNRIETGIGKDVVIGSLGSDEIWGGGDDDIVDYQALGASAIVLTPLDAGGHDWRVAITVKSTTHFQTLRSIEAILGVTATVLPPLAGGTVITGTGRGETLTPNGRPGPFTIQGLGGKDTLQGSAKADRLSGGTEDDILIGERGSDDFYYTRGDGHDSINAAGHGDADYLDRLLLGPGISRVDLSFSRGASDDVVIDIAGGGRITLIGQIGTSTVDYIQFNDGSFLDMEKALVPVTGTNGNDTLNGDSLTQPEVRDGALISDVIRGLDGNDRIFPGHGLNTVYGDAGKDYILSGRNADYLDGGADDDTIMGGDSSDRIIGGSGNDDLRGENGNDNLTGDDGNDLLSGSLGNDVLIGGAGDDQLSGSFDNDLLEGGLGIDLLNGGAGDDALLGGADADVLYGEQGSDVLLGEGGKDVLVGGAGDDILDGGLDADELSGGLGIDRFIFTAASGSDIVTDFDLRQDIIVAPRGVVIVERQFADNFQLTIGSSVVTLEDVRPGLLQDFTFEYI